MNDKKIYILLNRLSYTTKVFIMAKVVHTIKGHEYLYEHYRVGKKVVSDYIGKVGDEIENVVSNTEKTIGEVTQQIEDDIVDTGKVIKLKDGRVVSVKAKHIPKIKHHDYRVSFGGISVLFHNINFNDTTKQGEKFGDIIRDRVINSVNRVNIGIRGLVENININASDGYTFVVGDKTFESGGNWNISDRTINIFSAERHSLEDFDFLLVHEFGHSLFDKIREDIRKELNDFINESNKIKEEFRYSNEQFFRSSKEYEKSLSKKYDEFIKATDEEGGISAYSDSYVKSKSVTRFTENFAEAVRKWSSVMGMDNVSNWDTQRKFSKTYKAYNKLVIDYFEMANTSISLNPKNVR